MTTGSEGQSRSMSRPQPGNGLFWRCRDRVFDLSRKPLLMGVLNITPDSFSDAGRFFDPEQAIARGMAMLREGADMVDVGGESSRPGSAPVDEREEMARVLPVVKTLVREADAVVSIDTRKSRVAEAALAVGARIINDISSLNADEQMLELARDSGAGVLLMHMRGEPATMQLNPVYENVVREIRDYLQGRFTSLLAGGLSAEAMVLDPGFGFGKTVEHNIRLLACLRQFAGLQRPLAVGLSRKSFLGAVTGRGVNQRLAASLGAMAYALMAGARILRVHDVCESRDVLELINILLQEKDLSCNG